MIDHSFVRDVRDGCEFALVKVGERTAIFRVDQSIGGYRAHALLVKMAYAWIEECKILRKA